MKSAEQQLPAFKLALRWDMALYGHAATLVDYSWQREGRVIMLR